jgi:hypothetical protein
MTYQTYSMDLQEDQYKIREGIDNPSSHYKSQMEDKIFEKRNILHKNNLSLNQPGLILKG